MQWIHHAWMINGTDVNNWKLFINGEDRTNLADIKGNTITLPSQVAKDFSAVNGWAMGGDPNQLFQESPIAGLDLVRISAGQVPKDKLIANVPEPATLALLSLGGLMMLRRKR